MHSIWSLVSNLRGTWIQLTASLYLLFKEYTYDENSESYDYDYDDEYDDEFDDSPIPVVADPKMADRNCTIHYNRFPDIGNLTECVSINRCPILFGDPSSP